MRISPGAIVTVSVERLSLGGEGVARFENQVLFVPHAAPGDVLEVEVVDAQARFGRAQLREVLTPGPGRGVAPCPYHYQPPRSLEAAQSDTPRHLRRDLFYCGGCSWQHLSYQTQLDSKRALVQETLERVGGLGSISVRPVLGMKDPWRYRNKVQQPVGWNASRKQVITGFFAPGTHEIVAIDECLVQPELSVSIVRKARELVESLGIHIYDEERHFGHLRHFLVRTNLAGQALVTFVTRTTDFPRKEKLMEGLVKEFPTLVGFHQNINPSRTNVILGREWQALAGAEFIEETLGPLRFRLSPAAFFQVNTVQAATLYNSVKHMAGAGRRLLDLYSGVGAIALWLADQFAEVGGVEEVPVAAEDATRNAELNGIKNARFISRSVEDFLSHLDSDAGEGLTVSVDPPRSGLSPEVRRGLIRLRPERIVYVSCDPGTLARDLREICGSGYGVHDVQPVDLFPQTPHIETAVKLVRK